jgi:RNA polymerase sigma factor (sigma-70 family)
MERKDADGRQDGMELAAAVLAGPVEDEAPPTVTVHAIVEHDMLAFEDFYLEHRAPIARALALALGDADLAVDATDEAFTRAYERWASVRTHDRPAAWVYRVGMNWALSILRRRRRSSHRLYEPADAEAAVRDPDVHAALASLDVKHRSVIVCRYLLGWPVADIAAALGVREGTVKSRIHRATKALQTRLHHLRPEEQL